MKLHDTLLGALIVIISISIFSVAIGYPDQNDGKPGPWLFPSVLSVLLGLCGVGLIVSGWIRGRGQPWLALNPHLNRAGLVNIALMFVLAVGYILVAETVGFLLTMEAILLILMWRLHTKLNTAVPLSIAAVLVIYVIFAKALLVPLPEGWLYF